MCDPVTIGSIALSVAGAGVNALAQNRVAGARNDALAAERIRQQGFDREAQALATQSQDRFQNFEQDQIERGGQLAQMFTAQTAALPPGAPMMPQSSSNIVVQNEAARRGEARDMTDRVGTARADMRAFGDILGDKTRLMARDSSQIGQIGGFKRGSSRVLPFELEAANSQGNNFRMLGDVLGGMGRVGLAAGLSGGSTPFMGGAPAPRPTLIAPTSPFQLY